MLGQNSQISRSNSYLFSFREHLHKLHIFLASVYRCRNEFIDTGKGIDVQYLDETYTIIFPKNLRPKSRTNSPAIGERVLTKRQ